MKTDINNNVSQEGNQCVLIIFASYGVSGAGALGYSFLVDAYVVYDLKRRQISLAHFSCDYSKQDIELITSSRFPGAIKGPRQIAYNFLFLDLVEDSKERPSFMTRIH